MKKNMSWNLNTSITYCCTFLVFCFDYFSDFTNFTFLLNISLLNNQSATENLLGIITDRQKVFLSYDFTDLLSHQCYLEFFSSIGAQAHSSLKSDPMTGCIYQYWNTYVPLLVNLSWCKSNYPVDSFLSL